jgi:hypothetical protein
VRVAGSWVQNHLKRRAVVAGIGRSAGRAKYPCFACIRRKGITRTPSPGQDSAGPLSANGGHPQHCGGGPDRITKRPLRMSSKDQNPALLDCAHRGTNNTGRLACPFPKRLPELGLGFRPPVASEVRTAPARRLDRRSAPCLGYRLTGCERPTEGVRLSPECVARCPHLAGMTVPFGGKTMRPCRGNS